MIQTFTPENQIIRLAAAQDYESFYAAEIELRRLQNAPPVCDLLSVTVSGLTEEQVLRTAHYIADWLKNACAENSAISVMGPAPLPVVKVNNRFRYRVNIACRADAAMRRLVAQIVTSCSTDKRFKGVSVFPDNDPLD